MNSLRSSTFSPSRLDSLSPGTISALSGLMGRRRVGFFDRARGKGSRQDRSGIDGAQVHKGLEDGTKRRYNDVARLWLECVPCPCPLLRSSPSSSPFTSSSPDLVTIDPSPLFNSFCAEYDKDPDSDVRLFSAKRRR
jgi:hypothetical protein